MFRDASNGGGGEPAKCHNHACDRTAVMHVQFRDGSVLTGETGWYCAPCGRIADSVRRAHDQLCRGLSL